MGITLRLAPGKQGQQAKSIKIKGRCKKPLKSNWETHYPPCAEEEETSLVVEALSVWAIVRAFDS
jgi:hypothetical protein